MESAFKEPNNHCHKDSDVCEPPSGFNMANYMPIQNDSYKKLHEDFVSGNAGTSPLELLAATMPWVMMSFCLQLLKEIDCIFIKSKIFTFPFEFICIVMVQIYTETFGADHIYHFVYAMIFIVIFVIILKIILGSMNGYSWPPKILDLWVVQPDNTVFTFMTNTRTHLCTLVCVSILAVDFPIFPRRYAKTETFGYGLMDVGIGFFMIVNGMVAPEAKTKYQFSRGNMGALKKSLISSIPLLAIGIIRVIFVKSLNYQEHVTEYGTHWNFFFSLAFAKIGCSLVFMTFPPKYCGLIAIVMSVSYQILLELGLSDIIFNGFDGKDTRSNFIDANREGIVSCVSFTCMYLAGIQIGYICFRTGVTMRDWLRTACKMFSIISAVTAVSCFSHYYIAPSSRRLTNITYITWTTASMYFYIFSWLLVDLTIVILKYHGNEDSKYQTSKPLLINKTISYNFLLAFLLANVLTGVVNISMKTIYASNLHSYVVLTLYMLAICLVSVICYWRKWQLKLG